MYFVGWRQVLLMLQKVKQGVASLIPVGAGQSCEP